GDGSFPAVSVDILHEYTNPGEYTVVLTVYDDKNAKGVATTTITVTSNIAPVASFLPDKYEYAKKEVATFNATSSFDPDGIIIHYYWEFGDGSFATGNITKHAYSQAGNYTVILTVTDDKNAKGIAFRNIVVHTNQAPIAKISASKTKVYAGEIIEFTSTGSEDADGTITSYSWEFGDGSTTTGSAAIHSYTRSGNFTVTLLVTDNNGATGFATCEISVLENSPPNAKIVCEGWLFDITETISFSAFGSSDVEGNISAYHWDFGDGHEDAGMNVTHRYSAIGVYNVVLTIYDEKGHSSQASKRIGIIRSATPEMPYTILPFEIAVLNASEFMNMQIRIENVPVINNNSYALGYGLDPSSFVTFYVGIDGLGGSEGPSQELSLMIYCERYATRPLWLNNSEFVDVQGIVINYSGKWEIKVRADSLDYAWKVGETPTTYPPTYTQVTVSELLANNQTYKNQRVVIYNAVVTDSYLYPIYGMNLSHYVKFNISDTITSTELMVYANTTHRPTFLENYDRVNIWGMFSSYYGSWQVKVTERYDKIERLGIDTPPNIDNVEIDPYNVRPSQQVNITAHVIDDKRVSIVYLNYSVNNSVYHALQMIPVNVDALGNGYYKCTIPAQAENSVVKYYIRAFDNASQQASYPEDAPSTTITYTVASDTPPSFVSVTREPSNPYSNQDVTIFAKVTDDVKINSFQLFYSVNNGTYNSISMTAVNVDAQMRGDYKGIIPRQNSGSYVKYYLRVTDDASHTSYSPSNAPTSTYSYNVQAGNALNIYIGNLHSHTELSDGEGTPAEAYTYARDIAKIDVLGITDHTNMLTTSEWTTLKNAASMYTSNGNFVALYGQEFGSLSDFGHANIWECPSLCPLNTNDLAGFYSWLDSQNAISGFNHPSPSYGSNFNDLAYSANAADNMLAIELF
ncbi:MAG: PKD domain-containing protein, partial [Thermoplasmata archaeon]